MTWALCLSCGHTKFGAICPCPECNVSSCGDMSVDITFSDHNILPKSLEDLGGAIKAIHRVTDDQRLRFDSFMYYVSQNHPGLMYCELAPDYVTVVKQTLDKANIPPFTLQMKPAEGKPDKHNTSAGGKQPWWKFWKRGP